MLELHADNYRIVLTKIDPYSADSTDNADHFDRVYALGEERERYTSIHAVHVLTETEEMAACLLHTGGGATGIHERSAMLVKGVLYVAVGPWIIALQLPELAMLWSTQTDTATCFGILFAEKHQCLISHGELEIARISLTGSICWQAGGADIFTNGCELDGDVVRAIDWNGQTYDFDINTGQERT